MAPAFRIVLRSGPTPGKTFPLEKNELFIGRDLSNDVVINDPEISRRHSHLMFRNNSYILEDMGSTNGTTVNGQRLAGPAELHPGDVITLGERVTLVFESMQLQGDATVTADTPDRTVSGSGNPQMAYPPSIAQPSYEPPAGAIPPAAPFQAPPVRPPDPSSQATYQPISPAGRSSYQPPAAPPVYQPPAAPPIYQPPAQTPNYQPVAPVNPPPYQPVQPAAPAPQQYQPLPPPPPPAFEPAQTPFSGQVPYSPGIEPAFEQRKPVVWPYFVIIGILLLIILVLVIDDFKLWCPLFGLC